MSESTVPVKPFSFIYHEFHSNPRSRFFFSNVNLPLLRKHHQWIVLNRPHTVELLNNSDKWTCAVWLRHRYYPWQVLSNLAAPDEYLPFYALSDVIGLDEVLLEINGGKQEDLKKFNNTYQVRWEWGAHSEGWEGRMIDCVGVGVLCFIADWIWARHTLLPNTLGACVCVCLSCQTHTYACLVSFLISDFVLQ